MQKFAEDLLDILLELSVAADVVEDGFSANMVSGV